MMTAARPPLEETAFRAIFARNIDAEVAREARKITQSLLSRARTEERDAKANTTVIWWGGWSASWLCCKVKNGTLNGNQKLHVIKIRIHV